MITAVDTNVLVDVFRDDEIFGENSKGALRRCIAEGGLIASDVVWAEVVAGFGRVDAAEDAMHQLGVRFVACDVQTARAAGSAWRESRRRGPRSGRVLADFLVGAHAAQLADRLLTRDRDFFARWFEGLTIVDPSR